MNISAGENPHARAANLELSTYRWGQVSKASWQAGALPYIPFRKSTKIGGNKPTRSGGKLWESEVT